jgi:nitrile hydratase beta subunit
VRSCETGGMDGVHDLGGIGGFGAVEIEADEPTFHEDWERRVFRLNTAASSAGIVRSGGAFRHSIERMEPAHYLASSYYEHWLTGLATLVVERGLVSRADLDERAGGRFPLSGVDRGTAPKAVAKDQAAPRFEIGHRIRVRAWHPAGHTRAPRYVQGKWGVVVRHDGAFSVPDVEAHSDRRRLEPTYSVRFTAEELWGEGGASSEVVHVDLWESYLDDDEIEGR